MGKAIKITVKKAPEPYDLGASKFFGTPTVPLAWDGDFCDDEIFFCQIKLSDIAELDTENKLPHTGYLYIFLHTEERYAPHWIAGWRIFWNWNPERITTWQRNLLRSFRRATRWK